MTTRRQAGARINLLFTMSGQRARRPEALRTNCFLRDGPPKWRERNDRTPGKSGPKDPSRPRFGGARRDRTDDLLLAKQALSQLSYGPLERTVSSECDGAKALFATRYWLLADKLVGPGRLELPTSRLSGVRSNHLSYGPPSRLRGGPERWRSARSHWNASRRKRNEDGGTPPRCRDRVEVLPPGPSPNTTMFQKFK